MALGGAATPSISTASLHGQMGEGGKEVGGSQHRALEAEQGRHWETEEWLPNSQVIRKGCLGPFVELSVPPV